jgi:hypothetical protein
VNRRSRPKLSTVSYLRFLGLAETLMFAAVVCQYRGASPTLITPGF